MSDHSTFLPAEPDCLPMVSVIMAVFDGMETLPAAIYSLQLQTLNSWELILIDDCSTDGSGEWAEKIGDPRVRVFRNKRNSGLATSLNFGISLARAPYIARMDCDDVCFPRRFEAQLAYMQVRPEVNLIGCGALEFQGQWQPKAITFAPQDHFQIMHKLAIGGTPLYHPAWFGRSEWFKQHKYDECFFKAQDYELLVRAASDSQYSNTPDILIGYRRDAFRLGKRLRTRMHVMRAHWKNFALEGRYRDFILSMSATVGRLFLDLLRYPFAELREPSNEIGWQENNAAEAEKCLVEWKQLQDSLVPLTEWK